MGWYQAMKDAAEIATTLKDARLQKAIADLKIEGAEITEENAKLREENRQLRERLSLREDLVFEHNLYWKEASPDGIREGPFCPRCFHEPGKAVQMILEKHPLTRDAYECLVCRTSIYDPEGAPAERESSPTPYE